jgi:uncharacterized protein (DUF1501 family)
MQHLLQVVARDERSHLFTRPSTRAVCLRVNVGEQAAAALTGAAPAVRWCTSAAVASATTATTRLRHRPASIAAHRQHDASTATVAESTVAAWGVTTPHGPAAQLTGAAAAIGAFAAQLRDGLRELEAELHKL